MKMYRSNFIFLFLVFNVVLLSACSTGRDLVRDESVIIQRVDSKYTHFKSVSIKQFDGEVSLAGTVKLRRSGRGTVRDQINLKLTEVNGDLILKENVSYHRVNIKKGEANFRIKLNQVPQPGSLLILSLHNLPLNEDLHEKYR